MRIRDNIKIVDILDFGVTRENIVLCAAIFSTIPACEDNKGVYPKYPYYIQTQKIKTEKARTLFMNMILWEFGANFTKK